MLPERSPSGLFFVPSCSPLILSTLACCNEPAPSLSLALRLENHQGVAILPPSEYCEITNAIIATPEGDLMEFAISCPARPDAWKDLVIAEDHGFTHALFYDS